MVHDRAQVRVLAGGGGLGQHRVDRGQIDALRRGGGQVLRRATGASTATCSAVTIPSAHAAATAGSCSRVRPLRTI